MKKATSQILLKCGIPQHILGYKYLGTAIELVQKDENYLEGVTKELYPEIGKIHGSTVSRVERAIRNAVETAFDRIDLQVAYDLFGYSICSKRGKPTNKHFIAACVEALNTYEAD